MDNIYYEKYIKYKTKYIQLKGGSNPCLEELKIDIKNKSAFLKYLYKVQVNEKTIDKHNKIILNLKKLVAINNVLIDLTSKNEGLTKILSMSTIKQILQTYLKKDSPVYIIEIYNDLLKYVKSTDDTLEVEYYSFLIRNNSILFFLKIINEYAAVYDCYFLGDSTYKFKNMMEILRPDISFESILFSGNMYNKITGEIKEDYLKAMIENIDSYYENNKIIIDRLFSNLKDDKKRPIAIFDFVETGSSINTFLYFLRLLNKKFFKIPSFDLVIKNRILFINFVKRNINSNKEFKNISKVLGLPKKDINYILININVSGNIFDHIVNSDYDVSKICARCLPYYKPELWKTKPDVYLDSTNNDEPNYLGCNINRFYLYIYLISQFKNIDPDINKLKFKKEPKAEYYIYGDFYYILHELKLHMDPTNQKKLLIDVEVN